MTDLHHSFTINGLLFPIVFRVNAEGEIVGWSWGDSIDLARSHGIDDMTLRYLAGAYRDGWRRHLERELWGKA